MPGQNRFYFEVTQEASLLNPEQAKQEWEKSPFRTEAFARRHRYFPYYLPDLKGISQNDLLATYFNAPEQQVMEKWVELARSISARANCYKRKFGAIISEKGRVVAAGNNYTYTGYEKPECDPCLRLNIPSGTRVEACRAIHAEQQVVVNALNYNYNFSFGILTVAGEEPDGSPFMNPNFYCTVCSRILREVNGLVGVVTDTKEGPKFRFSNEIIDESFHHLEATL
jgi:deoxycytidylate deaminase